MSLKYMIIAMAIVIFLYGSEGLSIDGGSSVSTSDDECSAQGALSADDAGIFSAVRSQGPVSLDEILHVIDDGGKMALVQLKVDRGEISDYRVFLDPGEGEVPAAPYVSAEEHLTVRDADYILARTRAQNLAGDSSEVSIEVHDGSLIGYIGDAAATDDAASAAQSADMARGGLLYLSCISSDGAETSQIGMDIGGLQDRGAEFIGSTGGLSSGAVSALMDGSLRGVLDGQASAGTEERARDSGGSWVDCNMDIVAMMDGIPALEGSATFYVGGGRGSSIQGAVDAAWNGDSIKLGSGTYRENLVLDKSVSILGSGRGSTVIDGDQSGPVFRISPYSSVLLSGMTVQNGHAEDGGGIYNAGRATITNCEVSGNYASGWGGGIFNDRGTISLSRSTVSGNMAEAGGGINNYYGEVTLADTNIVRNTGIYSAGGFANWGSMDVRNAHISSNHATFYNGGGMANGGILTVKDSMICGNDAGENGGGMVNWGQATLAGCAITRNSAVDGGGIFNIPGQGVLMLQSSRVFNNEPDEIMR